MTRGKSCFGRSKASLPEAKPERYRLGLDRHGCFKSLARGASAPSGNNLFVRHCPSTAARQTRLSAKNSNT